KLVAANSYNRRSRSRLTYLQCASDSESEFPAADSGTPEGTRRRFLSFSALICRPRSRREDRFARESDEKNAPIVRPAFAATPITLVPSCHATPRDFIKTDLENVPSRFFRIPERFHFFTAEAHPYISFAIISFTLQHI